MEAKNTGPAWPEGYGKRVMAEVDSTLSEAGRIAPDIAGPEWVLALQQTSGRGRRGRPWAMPKGNFAATLVMPLDGPMGQAALRSFVVSLALRDALVAATGRPDAFALKWPNDVLMRSGKVAGILLETIATKGQITHLAIGIGVNLVAAPPIADVEANALLPVALASELGVAIAPEAFLNLLASAYAQHEHSFATYGFAPIRAAWLAQAARLGERITARTAKDIHVGIFRDVDPEGQLVLETEQGLITIPAGDVYF